MGGVLYILLPVGSWLLLGRFLYQNKYLSSTKEAYLVSSLMFASYCWYATIATGNQGGMIACLLVIAMCMEEHHPYFSGVLLALCMCKPQIAFVFFWPIVIRKKWKILGTSIAIVCAAWAVSALLTATNMFDMLTAMMNTGLGYTDCNFGLFNMIKYVGGSTKIALLLDVVFALTLFGILVAKIYKNKMESDLLLWYAVMSIISVLWFYHQLHDYLVLVFAGIYIMVLCMQKSAGVGKYLFMAVVFTHAIPPVFQRITARAFSFETDYAYDLGKTIECIIILCGVFYVMQAAYHYKQSSLRKAAGAKEIEGNAE